MDTSAVAAGATLSIRAGLVKSRSLRGAIYVVAAYVLGCDGRGYSFGLRGGESGVGGVVNGFGNGVGFGKPLGGSGLMVFLSVCDPGCNVFEWRMNRAAVTLTANLSVVGACPVRQHCQLPRQTSVCELEWGSALHPTSRSAP